MSKKTPRSRDEEMEIAMATEIAADMGRSSLSPAAQALGGTGSHKFELPGILRNDKSSLGVTTAQDDEDDKDDRPARREAKAAPPVSPNAFESGRLSEMGGGNHQQPWVAGCTNTPTERIVLGQLAYWFRRHRSGRLRANSRYFHDGCHWIFQRYSELF